MSIEQQLGVETPAAIVGEQEAGSRSDEVKRRINKLIKAVNTNMFDLAEFLHEAKTKTFYVDWGFPTYAQYAKSLSIKYARAFYLVRVVETMRAANISRAEYEPVGMAKLRVISELEPEVEYQGIPGVMAIRELTLKAAQMSNEELRAEVDKLKGKVGDDAMVWVNLHVKKLARENVINPALALAGKHIGSVGQDEEGNAIDPSTGQSAEMIFANFLADPNYNSEAKPKTVAEKLLDLLAQFKVPEGTTVEDLIAVLKQQTAQPQPETEGTPSQEE